jgi:hypothetical protein
MGARATLTADATMLKVQRVIGDAAYLEAKQQLQDAWKDGNAREVARVHDTGDQYADAYLDGVLDLTTAWQRSR